MKQIVDRLTSICYCDYASENDSVPYVWDSVKSLTKDMEPKAGPDSLASGQSD